MIKDSTVRSLKQANLWFTLVICADGHTLSAHFARPNREATLRERYRDGYVLAAVFIYCRRSEFYHVAVSKIMRKLSELRIIKS